MTTISTIYGLRKQLGLDDDTARDLYERETGARSLKAMSPGQQVRVLQALRREAEQSGTGRAPRLTGPYAGKLIALWLDGWNLGVVRVRTDAALLSFVENRTKIPHTRFLRAARDARKAVEALKAMCERAGVVWGEYPDPADCVIAAQGRMLDLAAGEPGASDPLSQAYWAWRGGDLGPEEKTSVMQRLGQAVRGRT